MASLASAYRSLAALASKRATTERRRGSSSASERRSSHAAPSPELIMRASSARDASRLPVNSS
jgi:hypothetical protein